jgi:metal-responsive CopG/Arc/MetJ family transcriptional regulator
MSTERTHATRLDLRIPRDLLAELDARLAGRNRSRFIRDAIQAALAAERVKERKRELDLALKRGVGRQFFENDNEGI